MRRQGAIAAGSTRRRVAGRTRSTLGPALAAAAGVAVAAMASPALGQVAGSWVGGGTGQWLTSSNWSSHPLVPNNGGTAVFNTGQASVTLGTTISLKHLKLDTPGQVSLWGSSLSFQNMAWIEAARSKRSAPGTFYYAGHEIMNGISTGSVTVRFSGPGAVVIRSSNFWPGPTLADGGVQLGLGSTSALGSSSGTLQLDGATVAALTSAGTLDLSRTIQILPGGGTLSGITSTLRIGGGTLVGGGPLAFAGPAGVRLETGAAWAGDARVVGGGTVGLTLSNNGALPFYNNMAVSGVLHVDYFSGAQDRLGAGTLTLRGGTLSLNASSASESIGTVVLAGGQNVISLPGTSGTFTLNAQKLLLAEHGTLRVVADGLGGTNGFGRQNRVFFADASNLPLVGGGGAAGSRNVSIIPFAHAQSIFGSPYTFVTYDPAVGLRTLDVTNEFSLGFPAELVSTDNVRSSGEVNINDPRTINSLLHGGLPQAVSGSATLTITSGAMMGAGAGSMSGFISCPVDFGPAEAFVTNMTVFGPLSGTGGVTVNGTSTFSGASTYVGPTTINSGTLSLNLSQDLVPGQPGPLGADTSPVVLMGRGTGAVLQINGGRQVGRDLLVRADADLLRGFEPALRFTGFGTFTGGIELQGPLRVEGSPPILLSGPITGPGRLIIATGTSSTVSISGTNTFSGGVHLNSGSLNVLSDQALGTGTLYVGDGPTSNQPLVLGIGPAFPSPARAIDNPLVLADTLYLRGLTGGGPPGTLDLNGPVDLNGEQRLVFADRLLVTINGPVSGGELRWCGDGTLTAANSQSATYVTVAPGSASFLAITNGGALGGTNARLTQVGSISGSSTTRLDLLGSITVPAHPLNLYGTLRNVADDNTWAGNVAALGVATIDVAAGALLVQGGVSVASTPSGFVLRKGGPGELHTPFVRGEGGELSLLGGTTAILPDGTAAGESRVRALTIAGATDAWDARLDLSDNTLIVNYDPADPSPFDAIANQVKSGYAGGAWTGNGIGSSVAVATAGRGLGYVEGSDLGYGTVAVGGIDATTVLVRYTLAGDSNLDRAVDIADFALLAANFNQPAAWYRGDYNYDMVTGIGDFALLAANFNQSLPAATSRGPSSSVPEPLGGILAALAAAAACRRRRC